MISLGVDIAVAKPIAIASLDDNGTIHTRKVGRFQGNGAQRLAAIRSALVVVFSEYREVQVIAVETPFSRHMNASLTALLQAQGVALEAAQAAHPGAVVVEPAPQQWKCGSVGKNCSKPEYIAHAQGMGLDSGDEDLAAAVCLAQFGFLAWWREIDRMEAA